MALDTVADYVSDARTLLQDTISPYRYADLELVTALNVTMMDVRRLRPDIFLTMFGPSPQDKDDYPLSAAGDDEAYPDSMKDDGEDSFFPQFTANDTTQVPIEYQFRLAVVHGMCAHALARDQEDVQDVRSARFMAVFQSMLTGTVSPPIAAMSGAPPQGGQTR